jgi:hypothetical protein
MFDNRKSSTELLPKLNTKAKLEIDPDLCSISSDYDMLSDLFDFKKIMDSPNFGIKRYKNATYKG